MLYITTVKTLPDIPETIEEMDKVWILYKITDTVKMSDVESLLSLRAEKKFAEYEDRNDMLVSFGIILSQLENGEECVLGDGTLPVPKRFEDRVKKAIKPAKASKKRQVPKHQASKPIPPADPVVEAGNDHSAESPKESALVKHKEASIPESSVPPMEEKDIREPVQIPDDAAEKLQALLQVDAPSDYPFPVSMFYLDVAQTIADAKDNAEIKSKLTELYNGNDSLWLKTKSVLSKAKKIVKL